MFTDKTRSHRYIFLFGCLLLVVELGVLVLVSTRTPKTPAQILAIILVSGVGGQAGAIFAGLRWFREWPLIGILAAFNIMHLAIFFPLITTLYNQCSRVKFLGKWLKTTRHVAERQKDWVTHMGLFGLPVFIWLPFPWTGTLVGSVIGYLMGIRTSKIMAIAVPAMLISCLTWVFGVKWLKELANIKDELTIAVVIGLILLFTFLRIRAERKEKALEESHKGEKSDEKCQDI
ncbi:MAG: small multi-drug export protein [Planctomycetes bacterium]|nr:small multi-drug export protein [Planctomycetota bacterium]